MQPPPRSSQTPPRFGVEPDASWRASGLLHTALLLSPLPSLNVRFACAVTAACTHTGDEGIDVPYGEPVELCEDLIAGKDTAFGVAGRIRSWRIRSWRVPSWRVRP
ncbi:hypothetical protein ACGFZJ_34595 [Streptomyces sp. NPDC048253]|uniref:hypothetical protein n=1 Tax=Streptomyces sp. NPDC048253 TaxID=3365524 RepID=UPI00370FDBF2